MYDRVPPEYSERLSLLKKVDKGKIISSLLIHAHFVPEVDDIVQQLIAYGKEHEQRIRNKIAKLYEDGRFFTQDEEDIFELEINLLLQDIRTNITDPKIGVQLVSEFYEADERIFNMTTGECFTYTMLCKVDAKNLFVKYAKLCPDKEYIVEVFLRLAKTNPGGVRNALYASVAEIFPKIDALNLLEKMRHEADPIDKRNLQKTIDKLNF